MSLTTLTRKYSATVLPVIIIKDEAYIVAGADSRLIGKYHEKRNEWTNFYPNDVDFFGGGATPSELDQLQHGEANVFKMVARREFNEELGMAFNPDYKGPYVMDPSFLDNASFVDADFGVDEKGVHRKRRIFVCKWPKEWVLEIIRAHMLNNALGKNDAVNKHPADPEFGHNPTLEKLAPELYKVSELRVAMENFARIPSNDNAAKHIARHLPSYDISGNCIQKATYAVPVFALTAEGIPFISGTKPYEASEKVHGLARVPFFAADYFKKAGPDAIFDLIDKV